MTRKEQAIASLKEAEKWLKIAKKAYHKYGGNVLFQDVKEAEKKVKKYGDRVLYYNIK